MLKENHIELKQDLTLFEFITLINKYFCVKTEKKIRSKDINIWN